MSQENVEALRKAYKAFGRRDFDRALECVDADVTLRPGIEGPDNSRRYQGHDGLRQFWQEIGEPWGTQTIEPVEIVEASGDRLLGVEQWHVLEEMASNSTSRSAPSTRFAGLIVRIDGFVDKADALEAAGLSA